MNEIKDRIKEWCALVEEQKITSWDDFPFIPLYMDQVVSILTDRLNAFKRDEGDRLLTGTMINNYVKNEVIAHPVHKKYNREQIAAISVIAMLKSVLQIQDLKILLKDCPNMEDFYSSFTEAQESALSGISEDIKTSLEKGDNLKLLALRLSAEAAAKRAAAERILLEIGAEANGKQIKLRTKKQGGKKE